MDFKDSYRILRLWTFQDFARSLLLLLLYVYFVSLGEMLWILFEERGLRLSSNLQIFHNWATTQHTRRAGGGRELQFYDLKYFFNLCKIWNVGMLWTSYDHWIVYFPFQFWNRRIVQFSFPSWENFSEHFWVSPEWGQIHSE